METCVPRGSCMRGTPRPRGLHALPDPAPRPCSPGRWWMLPDLAHGLGASWLRAGCSPTPAPCTLGRPPTGHRNRGPRGEQSHGVTPTVALLISAGAFADANGVWAEGRGLAALLTPQPQIHTARREQRNEKGTDIAQRQEDPTRPQEKPRSGTRRKATWAAALGAGARCPFCLREGRGPALSTPGGAGLLDKPTVNRERSR